MNLRLRLIVEWFAIAILSSLAVFLALQWRGTASFDNLFYDQLSGLSRPAADADVLLVTIDDPSLQALGNCRTTYTLGLGTTFRMTTVFGFVSRSIGG